MVENVELALLRGVAAALAGADSASAGLQRVVDLVCEHAGWQVGHAYLAHRDAIVSTEVWHPATSSRYDDFRVATCATRLNGYEGLPGRARATNTIVTISDLPGDPEFRRRAAAEACGLRSALALPVAVHGEVAAVLEFFGDGTGRTASLDLVAAQLGQAWERWAAEAALAASQERFRAVAETAYDGIVTADGGGAVRYANPAAERMFGYPAGGMTGLRISALMPERMRAAHRSGFARFAVTGTPRIMGEIVELDAQRSDGTEFPIELSLAHSRTSEGDVFTAIVRDVTERRRAERFLRRTLDREQEAVEQLRSLDEMKNSFLTAVSHEMRTPLASVLGIAITLDRKPDLAGDAQRMLLRQLAENANRLDQLLEDLLDVDRLTRGVVDLRRTEEDVGALARRIVGQSGLAGRPVTLEVRNEPLIVRVDVAKVERILEHLLSNVARHTPPETAIWVRLCRVPEGLLICVDDDGPGVPDQLKRAIFEPFRQGESLRPHSPGTGLGLALVGRFAALHGGRAWVEDRTEGGAAFRVLLP